MEADTQDVTAVSESSDLMDQESSALVELELPAVDEALLAETVSMGFPELRVRKALMAGATNVEATVNWVLEHGEDPGIDDPVAPVAKSNGVARSWRCVETGQLFRTMEAVQMYAERTGRSNFEESTEEKKPLTPEEIAAKKRELQQKLAARRAERETVRRIF